MKFFIQSSVVLLLMMMVIAFVLSLSLSPLSTHWLFCARVKSREKEEKKNSL